MNTDILVIGGGSAGYAAARTAAEAGASCVLAESADTLGGLCILRGCMPSKTLIEAANRTRDIREAGIFGIRVDESPRLDWPRVQERKRSLISDFQSYRQEQLVDGDFTLLRGSARFLDAHRVEIEADDKTQVVEARQIIVATGSEPNIPDIDGLDSVPYHTSSSFLDLGELPDRLAILGGGAIGMEFAHCMEGFGVDVTVLQRSSRLLSSNDPDLSKHLEAASRDRNIQILTDHQTETLKPSGGGVVITARNKKDDVAHEFTADALLLATGRRPRTDALALSEANVETEDDGRIKIDRSCRTSAPHIFAAGDCASPFPVVHLAVIQGEVAASNALAALNQSPSDTKRKWNPALQMVGIFTQPEAVQIGFTVDEAADLGIDADSASYPLNDHGKGQIKNCQHGFVKLVARKDNGRLIGAAAVAELAVELAHSVMVAIHQELTAKTYSRIPHYHPTLAEIWTYPAEELAERCG